MAQKLPPVRKTKKSSYKPLSKLNQDNLTDLTRLEKPEYTGRVFFYNTATRTSLMNNVNVWFRDHQHTMFLLNRKQQAICKQMNRMQKDKHRLRKDDYKRRQQEIRDGMKKLQRSLLQRRVVQRFRANAAKKMAARGEKSLSAAKISPQERQKTGPGQDSENAKDMLRSIGVYAAIIAGGPENADEDASKNETVETSPHSQSDSSIKGSAERESAAKTVTRPKHKDSACEQVSESDKSDPSQPRAQRKSVRRLSDPDSRASKDSGSSELSVNSSKSKPQKVSTVSRAESALDVIPEVASPTDLTDNGNSSKGSLAEGEGFGEEGNPAADSAVSLRSRVVEVRKDRPQSPSTRTRTPSTRTRRVTYAALPGISPSSHAHTGSSLAAADGGNPAPDESENHQFSTPSLKPIPFASVVDKGQTARRKMSLIHDSERDGAKYVSFGDVPTRNQVMQDAMVFLPGMDEDSSEDEEVGKESRKPKSMAARIKRERKHAARNRARVLDNEPLVQYYRSVRGNLQPLLTKPSRRSFPFPSGRDRYQVTKLLREEHQKDLSRRDDIEHFFSDLFTRQIGNPKPPPSEAKKSTAAKPEGTSNHLELLLRKIRRQSLGPAQSKDRNSLDHLAECQYLRVYDWDSKGVNKQDGEPDKMTSWATAENSLKGGGFLALDFAGYR